MSNRRRPVEPIVEFVLNKAREDEVVLTEFNVEFFYYNQEKDKWSVKVIGENQEWYGLHPSIVNIVLQKFANALVDKR